MTTERRPFPWGWVGFFTALVVLTLVGTGALLEVIRQLAEQESRVQRQPVWRVVVHGEMHYLDEAALAHLQDRIRSGVDARLTRLVAESDRLIEREVARAFAPVYAAVPRYADWYYSLTAEYLRYAHALAGGLAGHLEAALRRILFEESGALERLETLPEVLQPQAAAAVQRAGEAILAEAAATLPPTVSGDSWTLAGEVPLDTLMTEELMPPAGVAARQLASLGAGAGAAVLVAKGGGALVAKKTVAAIAGGKGFQLAVGLAGKLAAKSAVKGGGALAGAGAGALACSPGGPLALLCGLAAGTATWVLVDLAALKLEEELDRERFEAEIRGAVAEEEAALRGQLQRLYAGWIQDRLERFRERAAPPRPGSGYRPIDSLNGRVAPAAATGGPEAPPPRR